MAALDLLGVLLGLVAQRLDVRMAEHGVVVERHLGVEDTELIVGGDDERVHLQHRHVLGDEGLIELAEQLGGLLGEVALQPERVGQRATMVRPDAGGGIDGEGVDLLGSRVRDLLDVHAALGGGHDRDPARLAVDQQGQVEFLGDGGAFLDVEAVHLLALGPGLVRDQNAAEHLGGVGLHVLDRLDDPDAALGVGAEALEAPLAAAAGVDLRLHDEDRSSELLSGLDGLVDGEGRIAAGDRHAELGEDGFGLVFVDVHEARGARAFLEGRAARRAGRL